MGLAAFAVVFGAAGCSKLKARDELNNGVAAFRNGKYDESIEHFKVAKDDDPTLEVARLEKRDACKPATRFHAIAL